ncbi:MAG: type 4a pilus biogenesis protein PilO [Patescibacteria group bacterium]
MRLKIFFMPLAILVAIVMSIWYIWPVAKEIMEKRANLGKVKENLNSILEKKQNLESLKASLDKNKDKEDFILNYLPVSRNESRIVNGINYIATNSGLSLISLAISEVKALENSSNVPVNTSPVSAELLINAGSSEIGETPQNPKPETRFSEVKTVVSGKYESIKMFLDQLYSMEMLNKISIINISKGINEGENQSGSDILVATINIEFGYMPAVHEENGSSLPVFAKNNFDFSAYSKLNESIKKIVPVLDEGQKGKSNPFMP